MSIDALLKARVLALPDSIPKLAASTDVIVQACVTLRACVVFDRALEELLMDMPAYGIRQEHLAARRCIRHLSRALVRCVAIDGLHFAVTRWRGDRQREQHQQARHLFRVPPWRGSHNAAARVQMFDTVTSRIAHVGAIATVCDIDVRALLRIQALKPAARRITNGNSRTNPKI